VALYSPGGARPSTYLIDKTGTVRRSLAGLAPGAREMEEFVSVWQLGQGVFESSCARCHGPDGALDICLDVKPLVGIGHRLSQTEIRERLRMAELNPDQFLIRSQFFKKAEVEAVIAYISGL
jgi:mono/diheme cytochrome c family protein